MSSNVKYVSRLGLLMAFVIVVGGGAFAAPGTAPGEANQAPPQALAPTATIDDYFAEVARQAPGFGGLYVDEEHDTRYVYLLQDTPEAVAALEAALTAVFGRERPQQSRMKVLQGRYGFMGA